MTSSPDCGSIWMQRPIHHIMFHRWASYIPLHCHYTSLPPSFLTRFAAIFRIGCEAAICQQEAEAFRHSLQEVTEVSLCSSWTTSRELDTTWVTLSDNMTWVTTWYHRTLSCRKSRKTLTTSSVPWQPWELLGPSGTYFCFAVWAERATCTCIDTYMYVPAQELSLKALGAGKNHVYLADSLEALQQCSGWRCEWPVLQEEAAEDWPLLKLSDVGHSVGHSARWFQEVKPLSLVKRWNLVSSWQGHSLYLFLSLV